MVDFPGPATYSINMLSVGLLGITDARLFITRYAKLKYELTYYLKKFL